MESETIFELLERIEVYLPLLKDYDELKNQIDLGINGFPMDEKQIPSDDLGDRLVDTYNSRSNGFTLPEQDLAYGYFKRDYWHCNQLAFDYVKMAENILSDSPERKKLLDAAENLIYRASEDLQAVQLVQDSYHAFDGSSFECLEEALKDARLSIDLTRIHLDPKKSEYEFVLAQEIMHDAEIQYGMPEIPGLIQK
jgi:hypothetical protein